jgi:hypothetical protein
MVRRSLRRSYASPSRSSRPSSNSAVFRWYCARLPRPVEKLLGQGGAEVAEYDFDLGAKGSIALEEVDVVAEEEARRVG